MQVKGTSKARTGHLFISGSVYHRIPIFRAAHTAEIFLQALEAYRQKYNFLVIGYVLMPDHFHLLIWFPENGRFVDFLRDFKSFVGRRVIQWLKGANRLKLLDRFRIARPGTRRKDPKYCVLQYNSYIKSVRSTRGLWETLEYIHLNPVKDGLAQAPDEYPYSSAAAYAGGESRIVIIEKLR